MAPSDVIQLEKMILDGNISLEAHAPLIRNILNDDNGGYLMLHLKPYLQIIFGGVSRYWEYSQANNINIINSPLPAMYRQYTNLVSRWQVSSGRTDILIFTFQGNVSECLPKFHLCNTRLIPKFAGSGIYKELNNLGYKTSMIQFRDCVQLWYDDESITQHIISEISSSINKLSPQYVVFLGSSAGAYAALKYYHLTDITNSHINQQVIANGPQCDVFTSSFMRHGEDYRQALWEMNGAHPISLKRYWKKSNSNITLLYGDKCEEDYVAAIQIAGISKNARLIPINSEDHAPAKRRDFIKHIIRLFHKI